MVMSKLTFATAFVAMIAGANAGAHTGFCNGKSMGIYRVPGEPQCTQKYFQCVGSDDAVPGMCGDATRFVAPTVEGGWNYMCDWTARVAECQDPPVGFCTGKADGPYPKPGSADCTRKFWLCSGSYDPTEEMCNVGEAFDKVNNMCKPEADIAACNIGVDPVGYCAGNTWQGAFANPNEADPSCARTYWACNWSGATDAVERSCPPGTVIHFNTGTPTWNFWCKAAPSHC